MRVWKGPPAVVHSSWHAHSCAATDWKYVCTCTLTFKAVSSCVHGPLARRPLPCDTSSSNNVSVLAPQLTGRRHEISSFST